MRPAYRLILLLFLLALGLWILWELLQGFLSISVKLGPPSFRDQAGDAWLFVSFCLGVGGLTMAAIQIFRTLCPIRGYFHQQALRQWLQQKPISRPLSKDQSEFLDGLGGEDRWAGRALEEFDGSANQRPPGRTAGFVRRLFLVPQVYDLPIEQLCGQLTVALESAVDHTDRFRYFLISLSGWDTGKDLLPALDLQAQATGDPFPKELSDAASARATLIRMSQMRIDHFQISAGGQWRRRLRISVVLVSIACSWLISAATLKASDKGIANSLGYLFYSALVGLIAASVAMILRDLTAIVEIKRRG